MNEVLNEFYLFFLLNKIIVSAKLARVMDYYKSWLNIHFARYKLNHVSMCICVPPIWISKMRTSVLLIERFTGFCWLIIQHSVLNSVELLSIHQFANLMKWMRLEIEFGDLIPFEIQPMNTVHNYTYTHINGQFRCTQKKWYKMKMICVNCTKWQHNISFIRIAFILLTWFNTYSF